MASEFGEIIELPRKFSAEEKITFDGKVLRFTSNVLDFEVDDDDIKTCCLNIKDKAAVKVVGDLMTIKTSSGIVKVRFCDGTAGPVVERLDVRRVSRMNIFGISFNGELQSVYIYNDRSRVYNAETGEISLYTWYTGKIRTMKKDKAKIKIESHLKKRYDLQAGTDSKPLPYTKIV